MHRAPWSPPRSSSTESNPAVRHAGWSAAQSPGAATQSAHHNIGSSDGLSAFCDVRSLIGTGAVPLHRGAIAAYRALHG